MGCLVLTLDAGAARADQPVVDSAGRDRGDPNGQLSPRATRYSASSVFPGPVFGAHDGGCLGIDGAPANVDGLVRSEFRSLGRGIVWRGPLSQLAIALRHGDLMMCRQLSRLLQCRQNTGPTKLGFHQILMPQPT